MYHGLTFPFMTLVLQKQPVPRHTAYLADLESEDAGKRVEYLHATRNRLLTGAQSKPL
jgi:hypothetical protein